jgi:uncharacterized protein (TIGR00255 family)
MTGFGRGEAAAAGVRVVADVRTVNHRFLDVDLRGTPLPPRVEARLREEVAARISRGRVDVALSLELTDPEAIPVRVNRASMHALVAALRDLGREMNVADALTLDHLAALPWARAIESVELSLNAAQESAVHGALATALDLVVGLRCREGEELRDDLCARLGALRDLLARVKAAAAAWPAQHLERLKARMAELLAGHALDEARLAQEAALLADRTDASEEVARLSAYLTRLEEMLAAPGPAGKRLEFTLQEALREVNTLGSKSRDVAVSSLVIEMKAELERMREQVANVE